MDDFHLMKDFHKGLSSVLLNQYSTTYALRPSSIRNNIIISLLEIYSKTLKVESEALFDNSIIKNGK